MQQSQANAVMKKYKRHVPDAPRITLQYSLKEDWAVPLLKGRSEIMPIIFIFYAARRKLVQRNNFLKAIQHTLLEISKQFLAKLTDF